MMVSRAGRLWQQQSLEAKEEVHRMRHAHIAQRTGELQEEHAALKRERELLISRMEEEAGASGPPPLVLSSTCWEDKYLEMWGDLFHDSGLRSALNELRLNVGVAPLPVEPPPSIDGSVPYVRCEPTLPDWFRTVARDRATTRSTRRTATATCPRRLRTIRRS